jgi:oligoribonuclease NrnB/cAMP/cGMP phosphodiesterase (DHH superfamily)
VDGKRHFNLDDFANYKLRKQYHKMEEVIEQVKEGEMPLESYTFIHKEAKLTKDEQVILTSWAQSVLDSMKATYPIDSLIRKKEDKK